ncbi:MAG: glycine-rich protein [Clostridium sp.]
MPNISLLYTGSASLFTIPNSVTEIKFKVWGAAGGPRTAFNSQAGCGGYVSGTIDTTPGQVLSLIVGQGGSYYGTIPSFGGGGAGGSSGIYPGAAGGGRSGVSFLGQNEFLIAGGGGGAAVGSITSVNNGGNGGGLSGYDAIIVTGGSTTTIARGGSQSAGGVGGSSTVSGAISGSPGTFLNGGKGGNEVTLNAGGGGGGGGGYFGGGGGIGAFDAADTTCEQAGAGGSSYVDSTIVRNFNILSTPMLTTQGIVNPPNTSDPSYISGIGVANSNTTRGGNGLIVMNLPDIIVTKSTSNIYSTIGETILYTITLQNLGPGTLPNVLFQDSIPSSSSIVSNSLNQDGTPITGDITTWPGTTLPNPLLVNSVSTITFELLINSTLPNPITNTSYASYGDASYVFKSNTVGTTLTYSILNTTKIVNTSIANIGDILTYTLTAYNAGNATAQNIVLTDTIIGATFINGSLKQDNINLSGQLDPPGFTLPNSITPLGTSTITFKVLVTTVPGLYSIPNFGEFQYSYIYDTSTTPNLMFTNSTITNTVLTNINGLANIYLTKSVDKVYARPNDILTYTFELTNSGNISAYNLLLLDTLPSNTSFVPGSIQINNISYPLYDITNGITLPTINALAVSTIQFQVLIN